MKHESDSQSAEPTTSTGAGESQEERLMDALRQSIAEDPEPAERVETPEVDAAQEENGDDFEEFAPKPEPAEVAESTGGGGAADADLAQQLADTRDRWLRAMAELENLRKRSRRDLQTTTNLAKAGLLRELLEVADNFSRALDSAPWEDGDEAGKGFAEGVRLIYVQFMDILRQNGLLRIEARGAEFDPNLHEAISQIASEDVPSQHVVEVVQEGYTLNDMVVRPAKVVVAQ